MMRNFARINNYYNNIEARRDWERLAAEARAIGYGELAEKLQPGELDGWRKVDRATAKLREALHNPK